MGNHQKKFEDNELQALLDKDDTQNATRIRVWIEYNPKSHFHPFENYGKDSESVSNSTTSAIR